MPRKTQLQLYEHVSRISEENIEKLWKQNWLGIEAEDGRVQLDRNNDKN